MKKAELLIPAGSLDILKTAVMYGADAVYLGGEAFGLRAKARNFTGDEMKEGIDFAHAHGVRVLTLPLWNGQLIQSSRLPFHSCGIKHLMSKGISSGHSLHQQKNHQSIYNQLSRNPNNGSCYRIDFLCYLAHIPPPPFLKFLRFYGFPFLLLHFHNNRKNHWIPFHPLPQKLT